MKAFLYLEKDLNKIIFPQLLCCEMKKDKKLLIYLIFLFIFFASVSPNLVFSENSPQAEMTVKGQIRLPSGELIPEEGLNVVLLKLVINAKGQVTPLGPQGRVKTNSKGHFEFLRVDPDYRAGYQLGTRVDGKLYSTKVFFFKAGVELVKKDIIIPGKTTEINKLEISQLSLVIESGLSSVTVTEILSFYNSSPDRLDTSGLSLEHALPKGNYDFTMIQSSSGPEIEYQIDESKLIINHIFPPGNTQIIFHYKIEAWFGSLSIQREFNQSFDKVSVFTPSEQLQIKSVQLIFTGKQKMHETDFLVWRGKVSDSNQLEFNISNVPVNSLDYIVITGVILFLLFLSVMMFYRNRLMTRDPIQEQLHSK